MAMREYVCPTCRHVYERIEREGEKLPPPICSNCMEPTERKFSVGNVGVLWKWRGGKPSGGR